MVTRHLPSCAVVEPWPSAQDFVPDEILVIPFRRGAALFSIGFHAGDRIKMEVRIGEHGVLEYVQDEQATRLLAGQAGRLFDIALCGRYREELWINAATRAYVGGQSYFNDDSGQWQELGPCKRPRALPELVRRRVTVLDRRYAAY